MHDFLKGLSLQYRPLKTPMNEETLLKAMEDVSPKYIAFAVDFELFQSLSESKDLVPNYWPIVNPIIGKYY